MAKTHYRIGTFKSTYPYIYWGTGPKKAIILPPTAELKVSIKYTAPQQYFVFKNFFPSHYTVYYFGYEPNLPPDHSVDRLIADIAEFIRSELGTATVVGISYGGLIAIPLVLGYPDLVEKMVMMISAHKVSDSGIEFMKRVVDLSDQGDLKSIEALFNRLYRRKRWEYFIRATGWLMRNSISKIHNPLSTLALAYREIISRNGSYDGRIHEIGCPMLVVGGTADVFFSESIFRELSEKVKFGSLFLMKGEHHMMPVEKAGAVRKIFKAFISESK